ncbi:hypothetical protein VE01_07962 [Pseudogymnoascus verrucosus]|uniref:Uncharacterized protein n=1 Tax=Pseudogymnoascus verrucosus TaxID=342668 RepID=A0A1B8GFJ1_9PEZI|nr:uncharacterized protein VE01_07962 [Pseudogymnoascus verrucosus]OBT94609.1 hypothetical protein VE01_07962 [Pseudogymnoascus verrucosus]
MTKTPAQYEVLQRPVWDPAPGTTCLWQCIKEKPLAMHQLSDRVLGSLYIAIDCGLIKKGQCNLNESDLGDYFNIRVIRTNLNLGRELLTPDGKAVVAIPVKRENKTVFFELRGAGKAHIKLPAVVYNTDIFKARYPNWAEWRDELLYCRASDGAFYVEDFESYPRNATDSTPPDWPQGLTRDRNLASEDHYRLNNLNTKTGLPKDVVDTEDSVQNPYSTRSQASQPPQSNLRTPRSVDNSSIADIIDQRYGFNGRNRSGVDVFTEEEIGTLLISKKRKRSSFAEPMLSKTPNRQGSPSPSIAPIEVHKAAFQAAFRDKSVQRTELFHALLPYITVADAEEILVRCQQVAAVISESKFE